MPDLSESEIVLSYQFESYNEFLDKIGLSSDDPRREIADGKDGKCETETR